MALNEETLPPTSRPCRNISEHQVLEMISKSLPSNKRQVLAQVLKAHLSAFDFAQDGEQASLLRSRACQRIHTGSARPIRQEPYRVSSAERTLIAEQVREMQQKGVVQESNSPWAAPVILVKKDGSWRFSVDYRKPNAITKKDVYPLPRIDDVIDCLHSAAYFVIAGSALGLLADLPMHLADKEKTAFVTPDGLYEFNVMPFGLCNAPATFERFMDTILRGLKWEICPISMM